ncbi:hypothetical protein [Paenibacillus marinisediminis]
MKSWSKLLVTTTVVAMMAIPLTAAAAPTEVPGHVVMPVNDVKKPEAVATKGIITEIVHNKYGTYAMLEGKGVKSGNQEVIRLNLGDDVVVKDQYGKKADLYEAVKNEWTVTATYGPAMTMSIPPQSAAVSITVEVPAKQEQEAIVSTGVITDVQEMDGKNKGDDYYRVTVAGANPVILNVNKDTKIVDEKGKKLNVDALDKNVNITATYGPAMTRSLPPIATAEKIVVHNATSKVEGTVASADHNKIHVDVKADGKIENDMILKIKKDTPIVDVNGKKVAVSDLKKGTKVVGYHSQIVTGSIPAQSHADMIIVQNEVK